MSTNEQAIGTTVAPESANGALGLPGSEGIGSGFLSPVELARMANEMFHALPEELQHPAVTAARLVLPPNSTFSGNPYAAVPSPTAPAVPGMAAGVAEAQPGTFVATPDRSVAPDLRSNVSAPAAPVGLAVPGAVAAPRGGSGASAAPPLEPAFAFLADARPLFAEPTETEQAGVRKPPQAFASSVPGEDGFAAIPSSLFTDVQPSQLAGTTQPPAPAVPGAFGFADSSAVPTFSFLEEARPLFSTPAAIPGPVPADATPQKASHTGKSSASNGNPFAAPLDLSA